ncbi:F-box domain-containing protein [Fusarium falciforme]|uniref:F-box domain-containing protein n=1 Tax=Fusarium falciforme TaxID=195108 RepID=UPI002301F4B6|nr:F-box domain-containing protein [Fusarium falciforme]WAO89509.1 F-box domain-containing protein [Fusarium falciforme]
MASENPKTPEAAIAAGRQHYGAKRFKPALEQFTRAMKLCPCSRQTRRERCSCKDFEKVAQEGGSIFNEAMYTCKCPVGKMFNKCDNKHHIQALDYRAATWEALQELDRARRDAEWILELAPRLPDGYLRLGKIARLQKKHEFAWHVYTAGIEVGNKHQLAESPKFQKLHSARQPLHVRYYRRDPLRNPREIVQRIFQYLDFATIVRCLHVSKGWRQYLTSRGNERFWRALLFTRQFPHRYAPSTASLKKLISYSGNDVRQIVIDSVLRFRLTQQKLNTLLQGSKNLESLVLRGNTEEDLQIPMVNGFFKKINRVFLDEILVGKPHILEPLLTQASESIQNLHIRGLPQVGTTTTFGFPSLPNLQYLRIEEQNKPNPIRLGIWTIAAGAPRIRQLWLSDVQLSGRQPEDTELDQFWPNLNVVIVNGSTDSDPETAETIQKLASIRQGDTLQYVDFDFRWKYDEHGPLGLRMLSNMLNQEPATMDSDEFNHGNQYKNLHSLRLTRALIPPSKLQAVLSDAIEARKLHTLDIVFPLEPFGTPQGLISVEHLRKHAWLRSAGSIRCLGIFEFRFRSYPKNDDDLPLPSFLATFPNLEVIEINSVHYEGPEFGTVIEAILKVTHLRKIYQTTVQGIALDQLRGLAAKYNVELVWGERPRQWPLPIEE